MTVVRGGPEPSFGRRRLVELCDAYLSRRAHLSEAYAGQNERDHDALVRAERTGRMTVERGL